MANKNYDRFRVYAHGPNELSAIMNIIPCGNDFRVEYNDIIINKELEYKGKIIAYQKFSNPRSKYKVFVVGGIKIDNEIMKEDGKNYIKVFPVKNNNKKKILLDYLILIFQGLNSYRHTPHTLPMN